MLLALGCDLLLLLVAPAILCLDELAEELLADVLPFRVADMACCAVGMGESAGRR